MACGSARECGAILDILFRCQVISEVEWKTGKDLLARIVAMLTKMATPPNQVREDEALYGYVYEYVYGEDRETRTKVSRGRAERRAPETER
jgi:hypothetical protein